METGGVKRLITVILFIGIANSLCIKCFGQIPIDSLRGLVENLKTEDDFDRYWNELLDLDQQVLVHLNDTREYDSLAIELMIRTSLVAEIHSFDSIGLFNSVPLLNFTHCQNHRAELIFSPIIKYLASFPRGVIHGFGGGYPTYQLEGLALVAYKYSLYGNNEILEPYLSQIKGQNSSLISLELLKLHQQEKQKYELTTIRIIGKWRNQAIVNTQEDDFFEFALMSDDNYHVRRRGRIIRLKLKNNKIFKKTFVLEDSLFGFEYELSVFGKLRLLDSKGKRIVTYERI